SAATVNATYHPSSADVLSGSVTLTLTANTDSACAPVVSSASLALYATATADVNGDGYVDGDDVASFVTFLLAGGSPDAQFCAGDMTGDGSILPDDVPLFIAALLGM